MISRFTGMKFDFNNFAQQLHARPVSSSLMRSELSLFLVNFHIIFFYFSSWLRPMPPRQQAILLRFDLLPNYFKQFLCLPFSSGVPNILPGRQVWLLLYHYDCLADTQRMPTHKFLHRRPFHSPELCEWRIPQIAGMLVYWPWRSERLPLSIWPAIFHLHSISTVRLCQKIHGFKWSLHLQDR